MSLALAQARFGLYTTTPNPAVGCVIVRDGQIIAASHHKCAGDAHAEVVALMQAGQRAYGSSVYVTLEPCFHTGRTPPCVHTLLQAQVRRVVIASLDPNPLTHGKSVALLEQQGIEVICGLLDDKNRALNKGFFSAHERHRPWVISKIAHTLDGKIALSDGSSQWITSEEARVDAHFLRAQSCCILTGVGTVLADNPRLSVRGQAVKSLNARAVSMKVAIVDRKLRTPVDAKIMNQKPYIFYNQTINSGGTHNQKIRQLQQQGAQCIACPSDDMNCILTYLNDKVQVRRLLVEAGVGINSLLLKEGLIDEIVCYISPSVMGVGQSAFAHTIASLDERARYTLESMRMVGLDIRINALLQEHQ